MRSHRDRREVGLGTALSAAAIAGAIAFGVLFAGTLGSIDWPISSREKPVTQTLPEPTRAPPVPNVAVRTREAVPVVLATRATPAPTARLDSRPGRRRARARRPAPMTAPTAVPAPAPAPVPVTAPESAPAVPAPLPAQAANAPSRVDLPASPRKTREPEKFVKPPSSDKKVKRPSHSAPKPQSPQPKASPPRVVAPPAAAQPTIAPAPNPPECDKKTEAGEHENAQAAEHKAVPHEDCPTPGGGNPASGS